MVGCDLVLGPEAALQAIRRQGSKQARAAPVLTPILISQITQREQSARATPGQCLALVVALAILDKGDDLGGQRYTRDPAVPLIIGLGAGAARIG